MDWAEAESGDCTEAIWDTSSRAESIKATDRLKLSGRDNANDASHHPFIVWIGGRCRSCNATALTGPPVVDGRSVMQSGWCSLCSCATLSYLRLRWTVAEILEQRCTVLSHATKVQMVLWGNSCGHLLRNCDTPEAWHGKIWWACRISSASYHLWAHLHTPEQLPLPGTPLDSLICGLPLLTVNDVLYLI